VVASVVTGVAGVGAAASGFLQIQHLIPITP
jgi:hypothetical protein